MKTLIIVFGLVGCALSAAIQPTTRQILFEPLRSQYHAQDIYGQYSYGYNDGFNAKSEVKTADGVTRGFYRLLHADGQPHFVAYIVDPVHGYRINSGIPIVQDTPEVTRAKAAHMEAWNTAKLESENSGMWEEMMNEKGEMLQMDKFKSEEMMLEKKEMLQKKDTEKNEMWDKKEMLDKKSEMLKWTNLPEPVKDTPEVEFAKREHFRAHELANARLNLENSRGTPVIYTSLVGNVFGGVPVLTAASPFYPVASKPTLKFNNPFGGATQNSPVVLATGFPNSVRSFTGEPAQSAEKSGGPIIRSFDSVPQVIKLITPVGSVAAADSIPFPVIQRSV